MAARSLDSAHRGVPRLHQVPRQGAVADSTIRHSLRPRLTALAPTAAEAVRYAGGWLFDQVLAGWDVTVITAEPGDSRPLRILGVRHRHLDIMFTAPVLGSCLDAVAVRTDLYARDERVRRMVLAAAGIGGAEVRLWGDAWPDDFADGALPLSHRLSLAARAFKEKALAAAAVSGEPAADTEVFLRGEVRRPDLIPTP